MGRHLVNALLDRDWEVAVLTRDPARASALAARGAEVIRGHVTEPDLASAVRQVDVLFHLAAWFEVGVRDVRRMDDVNVAGTANVLAAARKGSVARIVVTGTAGVFAPEPEGKAITEASIPKDAIRDAYVASKRQAYDVAVGEMEAGAPITLVCPAGVFGPGDTGQLGRSLALLAQGKLATLPRGFGKNTMTHAADVAEGHILAATTGRTGEMYLLGDRVVSFYDFYRLAAEAAGVEPPKRFVSMGLARFAARFSELAARLRGVTPLLSRASLEIAAIDVVVDASKARRELGWQPRPFEDRLQETMAWYVRTYREEGAPLPVKPGDASAAGPPRRA